MYSIKYNISYKLFNFEIVDVALVSTRMFIYFYCLLIRVEYGRIYITIELDNPIIRNQKSFLDFPKVDFMPQITCCMYIDGVFVSFPLQLMSSEMESG
jgi:hypothetical protein